MIYKIKIGHRTQKLAANNPKILAGCFFNPQNVYFEVCIVRARVVCFMNYAYVDIFIINKGLYLSFQKLVCNVMSYCHIEKKREENGFPYNSLCIRFLNNLKKNLFVMSFC